MSTILLVDDHPVFRQGLRLLLEKEKDLKVVGEAGDGLEAIDRLRELSPDIVVMDITMPNLDGIEATRGILSEFPDTKVVALSVHSGKRFVRDMLQAGAAGYILKESVPEEMIQGIRTVLAGNVYLSAVISGIVVSEYKKFVAGAEHPAETPSEPILRTKLYRPPLSVDIIPRPRLIERLEEGRHRAMTLISAPAGYGKRILASQWLEVCGCPGTWFSLDESDNDLRAFLTYLLAAMEKVFPKAQLQTKSLIQAAELPSVEVLARYLLNDLDETAEPFILVLDNYHRISNAAVHDLLAELLRHPSPMLHLALVTRRDPPLPIGSLRARGLLTEMTMEHLRFTLAETTAFLERVLRVSIDEDTAATLDDRIEGWVAGLRLAALSLGRKEDVDRVLRGLKEGSHYVTDYLIREVLSAVPPAIVRHLMTTSILDRFCVPLCDVLSLSTNEQIKTEDQLSGQAFIDWLEKTHLFVIPLDETHTWFRYHHLFRDLLRIQLKRRCSSEEIAKLHSQASVWFAENGLIDEALQHAIASNDLPYAVKLVEQHRYDLMNTEQWHRLGRWLKMLPSETVKKSPTLLITQAFLHEFRSKVVEAYAYRDQAESLVHTLSPDSPVVKAVMGEIAVLHGEQHILSGETDRAIESAEQAIRLLPPEALHIWSYAIGEQVLAYQMAGDIGRGLKIINEIVNEHALSPGISEAKTMLYIIMAYWLEGDLDGLKQPALRCLKLGEQYALPESIYYGRYFLGVFHYVRNELPEAERYLAAVVTDPFTTRSIYFSQSAFTLALIYAAQGRDEEASNVVELVISHTKSDEPLILSAVRAFQVELALKQGKVLEAQRLSERATYDLLPLFWFFYVPQLAPVKLLLAQNTPESLEKALTLLDQVDGFVRKANRKTIRIDVLALQALILDAQGKEPAAIERLSQSLALAKPGGFIRNFVELGPPMADLLRRLQKQNVAVDYIERILAAFKEDEQMAQDAPEDQPAPEPVMKSQPLVEPLTNRELDILELLAKRLQNKEIAENLCISSETVKTHLNNIYQKLSVADRREAVKQAKAIGVL